MEQIKAFLEARRRAVSGTLHPGAIREVIEQTLGRPLKGEVVVVKGMVSLRCSAAAKTELLVRRHKLETKLTERFPNIKKLTIQ